MKVIIAEKRDQANKIADALGWNRGGKFHTGQFEGEDTQLFWASGHLLMLDTPEIVMPHARWDDPNSLTPISTTYSMSPIQSESNGRMTPKQMLDQMKKSIRSASEVIISTDSDREGEAIGWSILEYCNYRGAVRRAWLSAGLDPKSIKEAFSNLRPPQITKGWYRASQARNRSDWGYMLLVRAYTFYAGYGKFGNHLGRGSGRAQVMSVGRVQTPALAMIVRRDEEIENFVARDHFKLEGEFLYTSDGEYRFTGQYSPEVTQEIINSQPPGVHWEPSKAVVEDGKAAPLDTPLFIDKAMVDAFNAQLIAQSSSFVIRSYDDSVRKENPPKTFSLSKAQAALAKELNIGAGLAQTILEDLYEQGWTSYARTSKEELPMNLYEPSERNGMLNSLLELEELKNPASAAMAIHNGTYPNVQPFKPKVFVTKQMEHYGIVPTAQVMTPSAFKGLTPAKAEKGKISHTADMMRSAYLIIAKQFIQALLPPAEYAVQKAVVVAPIPDLLGNNETVFKAKGERVIDWGWRSAFGKTNKSDLVLPIMQKGHPASYMNGNISSAKTRPPSRYTEANFAEAMENVGRTVTDPQLRKLLAKSEGIGTPATRKSIIDTLKSRQYVSVSGKGEFSSTPKGRDLIQYTPKWLSSPEQTAVWEGYLISICEMQNDNEAIAMRDDFVTKQNDKLEKLIAFINQRCGSEPLGERVGGGAPVTPKMKNLIKLISERLEIEIPTGALQDGVKAREYIDAHLPALQEVAAGPSQKQIDYAVKLAEDAGVTLSPEQLADKAYLKSFIDEHKSAAKPSQAQIDFALKLADDLPEGEVFDESILNSAQACKTFIDAQTKGWGKAKGKRKTRRKRA